jgi:hypothetical protein
VDWSRAVALSGALGGRLPEPGEAAEALEDVLADCAQAHASLLASISEDAEAERLLDLAEAAAAPNFASLRQRYRCCSRPSRPPPGACAAACATSWCRFHPSWRGWPRSMR